MMINEDQIKAWKKEHGSVLLLEMDDGKKLYMRYPKRKEVGLAMANARNNPLAMVDVIVKNCLLGGDLNYEEIRHNSGYLVGLSAQIDEIIGTVTAKIKKL